MLVGSLFVFAAAVAGSNSEARLYASDMTISRCISFMLKLCLTNSDASQSSSRGLDGVPPELAEVAGRLVQAFAEMPLPEAIDGDAGEQRILGRGQPIGECVDAALAEIELRRRERPAGLRLA